jgi:oligopeptide transport system substrate-binding protein
MLGACGRSGPGAGGGNEGQVLVRGNATEPESLDPHLVRGAVEWTIVGGLFEGLVTPDMATLEPRPGVAERWEVGDGGLVYTFHLRSDARWSDGTPLTAQDFVYSARRMLAPRLASTHPENTLLFVRGARDYLAGRSADFATVGVRALDARTLEIEVERPAPFFLSALYLFFPVRAATIEAHAAMDDRVSDWIRPGNLVGNGPFRLKAWLPAQRVVIERNPEYWDAARVRLREVHFLPIESASVEEAGFRTGQLHITSTVPLSKIDVYAREQPEALRVIDDRGVYFYTLNVAKPPLDDVRVRRALALAIDRELLTRAVIGKRPAAHFTPPGIAGYAPPALLRFDAERARALLAEAGYPGGRGMPAVELLLDTREHHRVIAEAIQQMWRRELGFTVALRNEETQVLLSSKRRMDFQIARGSWNATTYQDPIYFLGAWRTGGLYNEARWSNAAFDRLIDATWTNDAPARLRTFAEAETVLLEEMPAIPLFFTTQTILMSPKVRGWQPRPFADRRLKELWLEP